MQIIKCNSIHYFLIFFNKFRYLSAPEKDDIDSDSTDEDSKTKMEFEQKNQKFALMKNSIENPFKLTDKNVANDKDTFQPSYSRRKSRIVLDEVKFNSKESKNYAMEFENLYDNFERDVDFVDRMDSQNSLNSGSFKEMSAGLRKRSSLKPFGKVTKNEEIPSENFFNNEIDDYFKQDNNKLNRKSSILNILQSNINKKNISFCEQL